MIRRLLGSAAPLLALSGLASRILGLIRDKLFAYHYGAGSGVGAHDIDTYYAAFRLPDMIFQLLVLGTISAAFVPIFSEYYYQEKREHAWKFFNTCLGNISMLILVISIAGVIFAPWIVPFIVPGFSGEKLQTTIHLTRIMLMSPIFFFTSSLLQSTGNAIKKYQHFALAPIGYNLAIIIPTIMFSETYGVIAISYGVVIGALLHALIQLPTLRNIGYQFKVIIDITQRDFKEFIKLAIPRIFTIGITQFNLLTSTIIASTLTAGSLSMFNYATNIQSLPLGLVGVSISIVAFGIFSEQIAKKEHQQAHKTLREKCENIAVYIVPASLGLILLSDRIVATLLGGGKFSSGDIHQTSQLLSILSLGLLAQSLMPLFTRFFYAKKITKKPLEISITGFVINLVATIFFTKYLNLGVLGIGISLTISSIIQLIMLVLSIEKMENIKIFRKEERHGYKKIAIATLGMVAIVWLTKEITPKTFNIPGSNIISLGGLSLLGVITYFFILKQLKFKNLANYLTIQK